MRSAKPRPRADTLGTLGIVHRRQGRYDEATDHSERTLARYRELGDPLGEMMSWSGIRSHAALDRAVNPPVRR